MLVDQLRRLLTQRRIPDPAPEDPFPLVESWLDDARASGKYDDHNAMALATVGAGGVPSVRIVLCKGVEAPRGAITFFTNYHSRKGRELEANPNASVVFHWPHATRQVRIEGVVEQLTSAENDAYFASRPLISRLGAVVSQQSQPLARRSDLLSTAIETAARVAVGHELVRPQHWGGFRLTARAVELWAGVDGRLHERVRWERQASGWTHTFLSP